MGKNEFGAQKRSLLAQKNTTCRKAEGGLGIEPFKDQSLALKLCWCTHFLIDPDVMWVKLAKISISQCLANGPGYRTKQLWTAAEGLLLDEDIYNSASPFLQDLLRGFNKAKSSLCFVEDGALLPGHTHVEQILLFSRWIYTSPWAKSAAWKAFFVFTMSILQRISRLKTICGRLWIPSNVLLDLPDMVMTMVQLGF